MNNEIFIFLELVYGKTETKSGVFRPPTSDTVEGTYQPSAGEHGTGKRVVTEKKVRFLQHPFPFVLPVST